MHKVGSLFRIKQNQSDDLSGYFKRFDGSIAELLHCTNAWLTHDVHGEFCVMNVYIHGPTKTHHVAFYAHRFELISEPE